MKEGRRMKVEKRGTVKKEQRKETRTEGRKKEE
jgi:hypothetical protein